jgi:hypothetical protein
MNLDGPIIHDKAILVESFNTAITVRWEEQLSGLFTGWEEWDTGQFENTLEERTFTAGEFAAIAVTVGRRGKFLDVLPNLIQTWDRAFTIHGDSDYDAEQRYITLQSLYVICEAQKKHPAIKDFLPKIKDAYFSSLILYEKLADQAKKEGVFITKTERDQQFHGPKEIIQQILRERELH